MTQYEELPKSLERHLEPGIAGARLDDAVPRIALPARVGFGRRLIAWLIDSFLIVFFGSILGVLFGGTLGTALGILGGPKGMFVGGLLGAYFGLLAGIGAFGTFYPLWEALTGAGAGKRIVGIKIANEDGTAANLSALLTRYAVKNAGLLLQWSCLILGMAYLSNVGHAIGLLVFLGCFFALGESRQAFHDIAAHTAVYRKKDIRA